MRLVRAALRRPIAMLVAVLALVLVAMLAIQRMKVDIFPQVGSPTIYVAQPYGGMDPAQMEGYLTYYYEYHFLYITGIEHVESKSIQGAALMKLVFHEGTDMNQAMSEVVGYVNRSRAFMPPGAVPPFITRFDAGTLAVGQLVFSSATRTVAEMQDFAINRVRPLFATLPGVSAPPPFGGSQRTIVVRLNPDRLRSYRVSPEEAIAAVNKASAVYPSGVIRTGDLARIAHTNAAIGGDLTELANAPVRTGSGPTIYIRDIAAVENGSDILTAYAHVNGKRTVYIMVTKRSDASTLDVIQEVRASLPKFRAVVPEDVEVRLEFDQSGFVTRALGGLLQEGILGAALTGLMVLLFLRDWRSVIIVLLTIPFALLGSVVGLYISGQTINIMTLAGLALAVGVLVDEATVEIENIHTHMASGLPRARAVLEACKKTALPRLLAMLCILSVFVPSLFMAGIGRQLFVPMSLAVGFAMVSSYLLSSTLVPVLATWLMRQVSAHDDESVLRTLYRRYVELIVRLRWLLAGGYLAAAALILLAVVPHLGLELFPNVDAGQFQLRMRAPTGTRVERTEEDALKMLDIVKRTVGSDNVEISTAFTGVQPSSYPVNLIQLWTSGPHESVMRVQVKPAATLRGEDLREKLRAAFAREMPKHQFSFEAADLVSQVMSFGSPTPIEVAIQGPALPANRAHAAKVYAELAKIPALRDLQMAQPLDYPTLDITVDRDRAGQYGLTASSVAHSLVTATSSSRFTDANYWRDPGSGNAFQIQVEIPQHRIQSIEEVRDLPVMPGSSDRPLLGDVASLKYGTTFGLVERYNMQRIVSYTANLHGVSLGEASSEIQAAIARAGAPARGITVALRGQIPPLEETLAGLRRGLYLAIAVVFLLLTANFQSFRLSIAVLLTTPAVLCGVVLALWFTSTTVNIQSFMGAIMAIGISVANAILLVTFCELARHEGSSPTEAAIAGSTGRLRAVLMTAIAMIAGMLPLALGRSEGGEQMTSLGIAVIGGLLLATFATLTVLPALYAILQSRAHKLSPSLDPDDPESTHYEASNS
ncbi:MAG TPA: efflux RND transporter permease subunit [Bryobacteraceae bacterium]|nr:efflux RND transporter permease subunit [Bryobacteraceae bacterium]